MPETVTITMTREHARVVQDACEMLMRLKLGQTTMPTELLMSLPNGDIDKYCLRRDIAQDLLNTYLRIVLNIKPYGFEEPHKDDTEMIIRDD